MNKVANNLSDDIKNDIKNDITGDDQYDPLDYQLADLIIELNGQPNKTVYENTLAISKHTREGQIFIACSASDQTELLKSSVVGAPADYTPLILDNGYLYLRRYWQYQHQLAEQIQSRLEENTPSEAQRDWQNERLNVYFADETDSSEINYQKVAAEQALLKHFLILSGGPGTGKTTTITRILALLIEQRIYEKSLLNKTPNKHPNKKNAKADQGVKKKHSKVINILLAAPTGKAAIRMLDSINDAQQQLHLPENVQAHMPTHASTIHKLLGYQHASVKFKHNKTKPLHADVVLIDEASMIDLALMSKLGEAISPQTKLILIGDKDQLSSVEIGSVFTDLCHGLHTTKNLVTLRKNWRFTKDSGIAQLASAANAGDEEKVFRILENEAFPNCQLKSTDSIANAALADELINPWNHYFKCLKNPDTDISELFTAFNQYRILCALRRGINGSTTFSHRIEVKLAKQGLIKQQRSFPKNTPHQSWYHGRPVMITQNSASKGLANGDTGITLIKNGETNVYFPTGNKGEFKSIAPIRLPPHETTWAMTIHKSQGSEFNHVTLILPTEFIPLLTRQLVYTGITRAKKSVRFIADKPILKAAIKTDMCQATRISDYFLNSSS